jgi:hypothetical protein
MLFHTIGHEMVHVNNRFGNYYNWNNKWIDSYDGAVMYFQGSYNWHIVLK